jgi:acetolactate synthase I/II/III large subunit
MQFMNGAQLLVKTLENLNVDLIFGIPGAKIDAVFNALEDSKIKLIVCRHEQNAAFMAQAYGRIMNKPGIVLVTSGPGVSNLATGLLTATTEGDPIIAFGGSVARNMHLKRSHQNTNNVKLTEAVTKKSVEVTAVENIIEAVENAYRTAIKPSCGACFISLPQDVLSENYPYQIPSPVPQFELAQITKEQAKNTVKIIQSAKKPVLLLGQEASRLDNTQAIHNLLSKFAIPTVGTYQAAGVISRQLLPLFCGRVGLFKNQPGDKLLDEADVIITVGYNPVEYDPEVWYNGEKKIIHIDYNTADIHLSYRPTIELVGDISKNIALLRDYLPSCLQINDASYFQKLHDEIESTIQLGKEKNSFPLHPLRFIYDLRHQLDDDAYVICDIGSVYMWMARYFFSYKPHHLLFSNGQQTLGVALPWAISTKLIKKNAQVISISGDGGFLFSAMELETAVREKLDFIHFIWTDGSYNMVKEQELMKYQRASGVDFGRLSIPDFAKGFGAHGFTLSSADELISIFKEAQKIKGPVLIDVPIDYSENAALFERVSPDIGN